MTTPTSKPTVSLGDRIDIACDRFEQSWDSETPIVIEDLLCDFSESECDSALRELLGVELELRLKRGDTFRKSDYLTRLPEHNDIVSELFDSRVDESLQTTAPDRRRGRAPSSTQPLKRTTPSAVPEMIGKYRIVESLDSGGQATVYRAVHPELRRDLVIKFCHVEKSDDPNSQEALRSEGRVLASLEHPNLARVYDFDFHENRAYLVIEYVPGLNLSQFRKQTSPDPKVWISLVRQVAEALSYVHGQGVLHLDIKPQNILIDETGTPRLIDFGLARTETAWDQSGPDPSMLSGTLSYMSPEQARCEAETVGPRSDVFGLGGVMYFLVTGRAPICGGTFEEVLKDAKSGNWNCELLDDACQGSVREVIASAMDPEADKRLSSARELAARLTALEKKPVWPKLLFGLALVACLIVASIVFLPPASVPDPAASAVPTSPTSGEMRIRVSREDQVFNLIDSAPLSSGDRIEIRTQIPAGVHVSLFLFDSSGQLQQIESVAASDEAYEYRFPHDRAQFERIAGPAGTEFVFLCGSREKPVTVDDLLGFGTFSSSWPPLPEDSVIQVRSDAVDYLQRGRGFGGAVDTVDPQQQVFDQLNALRAKLEGSIDFVEGIAFSHID